MILCKICGEPMEDSSKIIPIHDNCESIRERLSDIANGREEARGWIDPDTAMELAYGG